MVLVTMDQHLYLGERGISQLGERHSVQGPYSQSWIIGSSGGSKQGWTIPSCAGIVSYILHGRLEGGKKSWNVINIEICLKKYPYPFLPLPLFFSLYHYPFIPFALSLSLFLCSYPYPLYLSIDPYPFSISLYCQAQPKSQFSLAEIAMKLN